MRAIWVVAACLTLSWAAVADAVPGGDFEGGPEAAIATGWTLGAGVVVEEGEAAKGTGFLRCASVEAARASWATSPRLPVEPDAGYVARCRLRLAGAAHFTFGVMRSGNEYLASIDAYGGGRDSWGEVELPFRTGPEDRALAIVCSRRYGTGAILFDDVRLERDDAVRIGDVSPAPNPMPEPTVAERARGFVVSRQPWAELVCPSYLPTRGEVVESLTVRLAPGEYEPLAITVTALRPLSGLRAELTGDLRGPGGAAIPAAAVEVGVVRSVKRWLTNAAPLQPGQRYERRPQFVFPAEPTDVRARTSLRLWLTVRAPDDATPGRYVTSLRIVDARAEVTLPLRVEVLPIALPEPRATYGMYYRHTDQYEEMRTGEFLLRSLRDMRAHGCNSFSVYADVERKLPDGTWEITLDNPTRRVGLETQMRLLAETGLAQPDHPLLLLATGQTDGRFAHGAELVRAIEARRTQEGWPELLWYLVDEPAPEREPLVAELAGVVHAAPGARTVTAIGDPTALGKYYDVWIVSETVRDFDRVVAQAEALGAEVWTYNCIWNGAQPRNDRYYTGLFTWAYGLRGNWQWCYCEQGGGRIDVDGRIEPGLPAYGNPFPYQYVLPGVDFSAPTVGWEGRREGIDDFRYLQALEDAVAQRRAAGDRRAVVTEAERFLADLRARARRPENPLPVSQVDRVYVHLAHPGLAPEDYDAIRAQAADLIVALGR